MAKPDKIRGIRGMNDILPADAGLWDRFEQAVVDTMTSYGYGRIRTPILEQTGLFVRGIGEVTDIVEKEMYSFTDALNGDELTLRPENTAAVVRASIEHNLTYDGPKRLWYAGPMFRHERPQKGRYRQFHQIGAEVLGAPGAEVDAELILVCQRLWDSLELPGIKLQINSLGQAPERAAHRQALIEFLSAHESQLDDDARRRLHTNPLRILDSKNEAVQRIVADAPRLIDFLGDESRAHFDRVQSILASQNLPATVNHRLVRGLDYYNQTVFEWVAPDGLTVCGGGRYDPLIEMLGGKASYGCGFSVGVERALDLLRDTAPELARTQAPCDAYVVHHGPETTGLAFAAAERLRDMGLNVMLHCGSGNMKSQFKKADAAGAFVAAIVGEDEAKSDQVSVKNLRDRTVDQQTVPLSGLTDAVGQMMADDLAD